MRHIGVAKALLAHGADVNYQSELNQSPLESVMREYAIAQFEHRRNSTPVSPFILPTIRLLLKAGADSNSAFGGSFNEDYDRITIPYDDGYTPLTLAARHGWYDLAALLLRNRASVDKPRSDGASAYVIALRHGHPKTAHLIASHLPVEPHSVEARSIQRFEGPQAEH